MSTSQAQVQVKEEKEEEWTPLPPAVSQEPYQLYEWSDDEEEKKKKEKKLNDENMFDITQWYDMKLKFGKYKGLTLRQMVKKSKTRRYLRWLSTRTLYGNQQECVNAALKYHDREKANRERAINKLLL